MSRTLKFLLCCAVVAFSVFWIVLVSALELTHQPDAPETTSVPTP